MSAIISIGLKKQDLVNLQDRKGYINLSVYVDDKVGNYGHNVSVTVEQSKEERDSKQKKQYVGNGKVVYVRDGIKTAKDLEKESSQDDGDDIPW
jgi:hypothetical protein